MPLLSRFSSVAARLSVGLPLSCSLLVLPLHTFAQSKSVNQVVKPPLALAYIDVATSASDMPGGNMMGAAMQGGQSGGLLGALGSLGGMGGNRGGGDAYAHGNVFGSTHGMGFGNGKYVDVSVYASKNKALAEAQQTIPPAMHMGDVLHLVAPVPDKPVPVVSDDSPVEPTYQKPKGKISLYWGCGDSIRPGQPRSIDVSTASPADYAKFFVMRGKTTKGARSQPGHPAWPNKVDDKRVPDNASLQGQHSFSGNGLPDSFRVTLGAAQDLMPPIQLQQTKKDGAIALAWQSIPYARGYFISVMGGQSMGGDSGEMIIWTSSELPDFGSGLMDYQSNSDVDKWINEKVILPANTTVCTVPKGIFSDHAGGMLRMIAYGQDSYFAYPPRPDDPKIAWEPDWQAKVRVKSGFASILGGMGNMGGAREQGMQGQTPQSPPQQRPAEEGNKLNPAELLKGLFGR